MKLNRNNVFILVFKLLIKQNTDANNENLILLLSYYKTHLVSEMID